MLQPGQFNKLPRFVLYFRLYHVLRYSINTSVFYRTEIQLLIKTNGTAHVYKLQ